MTTYDLTNERTGPVLPAWLDNSLLWIPNPRRPSVLAFGIFLVRVTVLPTVLSFALLAPFAGCLPSHPILGLSVMLSLSVFFEECGRFSFVRRADRPINAAVLFTALIITLETVIYWRPTVSAGVNLITRGPSIVVHLSASAAMIIGLRHRKWLGLILATVYVLHVTYDIASSTRFQNHSAQLFTATDRMHLDHLQRMATGQPLG